MTSQHAPQHRVVPDGSKVDSGLAGGIVTPADATAHRTVISVAVIESSIQRDSPMTGERPGASTTPLRPGNIPDGFNGTYSAESLGKTPLPQREPRDQQPSPSGFERQPVILLDASREQNRPLPAAPPAGSQPTIREDHGASGARSFSTDSARDAVRTAPGEERGQPALAVFTVESPRSSAEKGATQSATQQSLREERPTTPPSQEAGKGSLKVAPDESRSPSSQTHPTPDVPKLAGEKALPQLNASREDRAPENAGRDLATKPLPDPREPSKSQVPDRTVADILKEIVQRPTRETHPQSHPEPRAGAADPVVTQVPSTQPTRESTPVSTPELRPEIRLISQDQTQLAQPTPSRPTFESPVERVLRDFVRSTPVELTPHTPRSVEPPLRDPQRDIIQSITREITQATQLPTSRAQITEPQTHVTNLSNISDVRTSVLDKLSQISQALGIPPERRVGPESSHAQNAIQGRDLFRRVEDLRRDAPREISVARGDRSTPQPAERSEMKTPPVIDLLKRVVQNVTTIDGLRRIESALEGVCEHLVATALVGAIGAHKVGVALSAAILELIGAFSREKESLDLTPEEDLHYQQLLAQLALAREATIAEDPFVLVGDVTGEVIHTATGLPIAGVLINGGTLGTIYTDSMGRFRFKNIPIGSGFVLVASHADFDFFPGEIVGTATESSHFCFIGTPR